jgi:DNA-directed RNA polymerase specialized sigma24 family protein
VSGDQIPKEHAEELGECFAAYAPGLFGYACALTQGDHALADDLVQAAFMAAARQWQTMRCLHDARRAPLAAHDRRQPRDQRVPPQ